MSATKPEECRIGHGYAPAPLENLDLIKLPPGGVNRILVCQLRQIGDVVLSTISVELLARRFPNAEIHFLTEKKCGDILKNNPHIHKIWALDKAELGTVFRQLAFYRRVARNGFDLVVDFQQLPRCMIVSWLSGAPIRLSHTGRWYRNLLYTHHTAPNHGYSGAYKAGVLAPLGITWRGESPAIYLDDGERRFAVDFLRALEADFFNPEREFRLVTVDPTHRFKARKWPGEHYAKLIDLAAGQDPRLRFLLLHGPGEKDDVARIYQACARKDAVFFSDAMLDLRTMPAVMEHACLHIGNCSAPRHIATGMGLPTMTIHGASGTGWTHPDPKHIHVTLNISCRPCNKSACNSNLLCLNGLTPELVLPVFSGHYRAYCQGKQ